MKNIRVFLAVNVDVATLRRVSGAQRELRSRFAEAGWDITWLAPPNLNVILQYLGEIGDALPVPLRDAFRPVAERNPPIPLSVRGVRITDEGEDRKVIVAPVIDLAGALSGLYGDLAEPLEELGFRARQGELEPRLVLGRVRGEGEGGAEDGLGDFTDRDFGRCEARDLILYQSDGARAGEEYLRLWHLPLIGEPERAAPEIERSSEKVDSGGEESETGQPEDPSGEETSSA